MVGDRSLPFWRFCVLVVARHSKKVKFMATFNPEEQEKLEELVEQVKSGDKQAFEEIYEMFIQPLYRYVYYRAPKGEVEDILENAFLKVWENIGKYKRDNNNFSAWVFRITHNLIVDFYRARKEPTVELDLNLAEDDRTHSPLRFTQNQLDSGYLKEAMSELNEQYKEIIVLKFLEDLTNKEISQILDKSEGAVRILQFRALKALKDELTKMGIES